MIKLSNVIIRTCIQFCLDMNKDNDVELFVFLTMNLMPAGKLCELCGGAMYRKKMVNIGSGFHEACGWH